jgi:anti-sigma-K factor RskA
MTPSMTPSNQDIEPTEIESLLPWYAAGTLRRRDRQRVEDALRDNPDLMRHANLVREELAETIGLNESLGAPSRRSMDRLMAAIDAEDLAARRHASARALAGLFANFVASFSPRTLAVAATVATLAIALQAFFLVGMLTKPQAGGDETASIADERHGHGTFAMVRFARQASAGEITKFLETYQATLVDGPKAGGIYRVRIAMTSLAKEELTRIVMRMQQERVVEFAAASE